MALPRIKNFVGFLALFYPFSPLSASFPVEVSGQILYLLHHGKAEKAFQAYLDHSREFNAQDFTLLQQAGIRLMEEGMQSSDLEVRLMALFGAGVSQSTDLIPILAKGIQSQDLKLQLVALSYLGSMGDDEADRLLIDALASPFILCRMEACLQLATKGHPDALNQLQSLMVKMPDPLRPLFPQIAIHLEGKNAYFYMRQLLTDNDIDVRLASILMVAEEKRDDYLPQIRALATQSHHAQQECCALALGELKDSESISLLREFIKNKRDNVKLASLISLYQLGESTCIREIEEMALQGNLFAIRSLGILEGGRESLLCLLNDSNRDVRLNAALSLLEMDDPSSLSFAQSMFSKENQRDYGFYLISSPGGGMQAWKTIPAAAQHVDAYPGILAHTTELKEKILVHSLEFSEEEFIKIAHMVLNTQQSELFPLLFRLLENHPSDSTIALLKEYQQKVGAPLIRNYCTLALYRLKENGPYEMQLVDWVKKESHHAIIQFKEEKPKKGKGQTKYELNPEQTSRLLVDSFEALASSQNQAGIETLIHAIAQGHPKNRYALAGLLIRTVE